METERKERIEKCNELERTLLLLIDIYEWIYLDRDNDYYNNYINLNNCGLIYKIPFIKGDFFVKKYWG